MIKQLMYAVVVVAAVQMPETALALNFAEAIESTHANAGGELITGQEALDIKQAVYDQFEIQKQDFNCKTFNGTAALGSHNKIFEAQMFIFRSEVNVYRENSGAQPVLLFSLTSNGTNQRISITSTLDYLSIESFELVRSEQVRKNKGTLTFPRYVTEFEIQSYRSYQCISIR